MANRYWILGTGTWDATNTVNWSDSSGGLGGFSVPTAADNVFFDANSNVGTTAFTVTMANTPRVCNDFTASGLDGAMTLAGSGVGLTVSGSLTFQATNFTRSYTGVTTFNATTTGKTVTANGVAFGAGITFDGVGGAWTLGSALTVAGATNTITLTNGTLDLQSYTLSTGRFNSSNSNTRIIAFGTGQISCTGTGTAWDTSTTTGLTITGTGTIRLTNASAKTFAGGGFSYSSVTLNQGGAGALTITGSNTFSNITNTVQPASVLFTAGTTSTFSSFSLSGTAGNLITIGSVTAASHTLSKASGTVSADFLSISRSTATGGAGWYAGANSTDGGNNSGWIFTAPPSANNSNFLMFF